MPDPLVDGFSDASGGMDASRSPELISPRHFALGVNLTARDGMLRTRPSFRRVEFAMPQSAIRAEYLQGSVAYYNPTTGAKLIVAVFAGRVYSFDPLATSWVDVSEEYELVNDATARHFFCQAENFLVISNGKDGALIFDGKTLRRAGEDEVPTGTIMVYGQGRLFIVSPDFREITAGDLVYGGSLASVPILLSTPQSPRTKVTTTKPHKLTTGDSVTIGSHYSTPSIIGTWTVEVVNDTTFTIPIVITAGGGGGTVIKDNEGVEADVLRFTERTYLNEKGTFRPPASMGRITAAVFFPIQDTGTGQGDLLVGCENGACSFAVSQPRETWLDIQIQRVALTEVGFAGPLSVAQVNSDIFFGGSDGRLRSYRNARAEFGAYGNTPLSAEVEQLTLVNSPPAEKWAASMGVHDNRLLFTGNPRTLAASDLVTPPRRIFQSLVALDFQQSSRITKTALAAYDGAWTGLDVLQLVPAAFGSDRRLYAWCWQRQTDDEWGKRANELWEITSTETGYDSWSVCGSIDRAVQLIRAAVELRALEFDSWRTEKRLMRAEAWVSGVRGENNSLSFWWRPAHHGHGWFFWHEFGMSANPCAYVDPLAGECDHNPQIRPSMHISPVRLGTPPEYADTPTNQRAERGFTFQLRLEWSGKMQIRKLLAYAGLLVAPSQHDAMGRELEDASGETLPLNPAIRPILGGEDSYRIISTPTCEYFPCITISELRTRGPNSFMVQFVGDPGGPDDIQFMQGTRDVERVVSPAYLAGWYSQTVPNGFTNGSVTLEPLTPDDPDYTGNGAFRVTIYSNVIGELPLPNFTAVVPVDACFDEPLIVTLNSDFT